MMSSFLAGDSPDSPECRAEKMIYFRSDAYGNVDLSMR